MQAVTRKTSWHGGIEGYSSVCQRKMIFLIAYLFINCSIIGHNWSIFWIEIKFIAIKLHKKIVNEAINKLSKVGG